MAESILVRKMNLYCPVCGKMHEVEERMREATTIIKGEEVSYPERYYFCQYADEEGNEYEIGSMTNENLMNARNAYRVKNGLLTSGEIVSIREKYGLSQVELSRLLGWGEATISRYESKAIQDESYDHMLRLIAENPLQALEYLKKNGGKFSGARMREIKSRIVMELDSYGKEYLTRQTFEGEYAGFDEPSDANGYVLLDIDKLEAVISYFAERVAHLFKTKLMKLLWYADAVSFKWYGKAMTGLVYRHEAMGALPVGHYSLMNLENLNVQEEMSMSYDSMFHIYPNETIDGAVLTAKDQDVLNAVCEKFRDYKASEIVNYMHEEAAYTETEPGAVIPFSLAGKVRGFC
ncbi:MAG: DUF4065 domain-containing protein [Lachnospiraceae bacterium]|nr:DUF4065 domain-containing protein [Lachnospiraceae bacterium]